MATVFESISDGFYTAFFEPDPGKRKDKVEKWIEESIPTIQSAVENDLRAYLEGILEDTWTEKQWKARAEKYYGRSVRIGKKDELPFIDAYQVHLDVSILKRASKDMVVNEKAPEVRDKTLEAIEAAKTAIAKREKPAPVDIREIDLHENPTVEETIPIIEYFLKDSYRDNVRRVRIIHGKGIGVLREAVRELLNNSKYVVSISITDADNNHGGEGATEAYLTAFSTDYLD